MIKDELKQIVKRRDEILETVVRDREMPYAQLDTFFLKDCNALFAMAKVMIDTLEWYGNGAWTGNYCTLTTKDCGKRAREALRGFE